MSCDRYELIPLMQLLIGFKETGNSVLLRGKSKNKSCDFSLGRSLRKSPVIRVYHLSLDEKCIKPPLQSGLVEFESPRRQIYDCGL